MAVPIGLGPSWAHAMAVFANDEFVNTSVVKVLPVFLQLGCRTLCHWFVTHFVLGMAGSMVMCVPLLLCLAFLFRKRYCLPTCQCLVFLDQPMVLCWRFPCFLSHWSAIGWVLMFHLFCLCSYSCTQVPTWCPSECLCVAWFHTGWQDES